ncbi:hypothetical protein [uncultured Massilia sp.]|uniref:hypothetical protein n=1 Tax=uncultured Massilia sp. TaxID=169973 RepID=UPI0025D57073|nr:hypothetical protein [uncultured Massilia sp.]
MKRTAQAAQWVAAATVAAALSACAAVPAVAPTPTPADGPLPFVTLDKSTTSRIDAPRTVVVRDAQAWQRLWAEHAGADAAPPQVDFAARMVVGVFLGTRSSGCHGTEIAGIAVAGGRIRVQEIDKVPGPTVRCMMMLTAPAHLVATTRSDLPVEFATETVELK